MTLFDCKIKYIALPEEVLDITSKAAMDIAIQCYGSNSTAPLNSDNSYNCELTQYQRRQLDDIRHELLHQRVVLRDDVQPMKPRRSRRLSIEDERLLPLKLRDMDMLENPSLAMERIVIPKEFDYDELSLAAQKTIITLHRMNRYNRVSPFMVKRTQAQLAERVGITEKTLRDAIQQLEEHKLLWVRKHHKGPSDFILLDPESGVELYHLGVFYRDRYDRLWAGDRYAILLSERHCDPPSTRGYFTDAKCYCPLCNSHLTDPDRNRTRKKRTFCFSVTEDLDVWNCHACGRSGNSVRLWNLLKSWRDLTNWRTVLTECTADSEFPGTSGFFYDAQFQHFDNPYASGTGASGHDSES